MVPTQVDGNITISYSYSSGNITGTAAGGICGRIVGYNGNTEISNCILLKKYQGECRRHLWFIYRKMVT